MEELKNLWSSFKKLSIWVKLGIFFLCLLIIGAFTKASKVCKEGFDSKAPNKGAPTKQTTPPNKGAPSKATTPNQGAPTKQTTPPNIGGPTGPNQGAPSKPTGTGPNQGATTGMGPIDTRENISVGAETGFDKGLRKPTAAPSCAFAPSTLLAPAPTVPRTIVSVEAPQILKPQPTIQTTVTLTNPVFIMNPGGSLPPIDYFAEIPNQNMVPTSLVPNNIQSSCTSCKTFY